LFITKLISKVQQKGVFVLKWFHWIGFWMNSLIIVNKDYWENSEFINFVWIRTKWIAPTFCNIETSIDLYWSILLPDNTCGCSRIYSTLLKLQTPNSKHPLSSSVCRNINCSCGAGL
jgi:hypothetical protein